MTNTTLLFHKSQQTDKKMITLKKTILLDDRLTHPLSLDPIKTDVKITKTDWKSTQIPETIQVHSFYVRILLDSPRETVTYTPDTIFDMYPI